MIGCVSLPSDVMFANLQLYFYYVNAKLAVARTLCILCFVAYFLIGS